MAEPGANEEAIAVLNDLIEMCREDEQDFRLASEGVKNADLRQFFHDSAGRCARYIEELRSEDDRLGGGSGSAASVYRSSANIRSALAAGNEAAVLSEIERGEDQAVKSYREALGAALPPTTRALLQRQLRQVQESYDRLRVLQPRRAA